MHDVMLVLFDRETLLTTVFNFKTRPFLSKSVCTPSPPPSICTLQFGAVKVIRNSIHAELPSIENADYSPTTLPRSTPLHCWFQEVAAANADAAVVGSFFFPGAAAVAAVARGDTT